MYLLNTVRHFSSSLALNAVHAPIYFRLGTPPPQKGNIVAPHLDRGAPCSVPQCFLQQRRCSSVFPVAFVLRRAVAQKEVEKTERRRVVCESVGTTHWPDQGQHAARKTEEEKKKECSGAPWVLNSWGLTTCAGTPRLPQQGPMPYNPRGLTPSKF